MRRMRRVLAAVATVAALLAGLPLLAEEAYTAHPLGSTAAPYGYLEHLPAGYSKSDKARHPLILFLHGYGELGDSAKDLPKVAVYGPLKMIATQAPLAKVFADQAAIIVAPQGLKADGWWRTEKLVATLNFAISQHAVDLDRVYVTGLSMGGGGTWSLATAVPDKLAAIVPICGAAGPGNVAKLHGLPIWAHHAFLDGTVKFQDNTRAWFDAILNDLQLPPPGGVMAGYQHNDKPWTGMLVRTAWQWQEGILPPTAPSGQQSLILTVHPDKSHDSWTRTYQNPAVWEWLFKQNRASRLKPETKH